MRVYIDTSVVGGVFDEEFAEPSEAFFAKASSGEFVVVVSDLLHTELLRAPARVREYLNDRTNDVIELVALTDEARDLADRYIAESVVGKTSIVDCQHIAVATIQRVDVLVSWNFRHIVNLTRIRGYNSVNLTEGYPMLEIRTPLEVMES